MRIKHELVRQLRLARGATQQEVADQIEVDVRTYRKYESGAVNNGPAEPLRASQYETLRGLSALFSLPGPEHLIDSRPATAAANARPHYVHREREERKAQNRLRHPGAPVVLQGPEHFGVSTLLDYLLDQATLHDEDPCQVVRIHLGHLERGCFDSLERLLLSIGRLLLEGGVPSSGPAPAPAPAADRLAAAWERPGSEKSKLTFVLEEHVLPRAARVYLALEHADRLLAAPFRDDFFSLLRGWAEAGEDGPWSHLRLLATVRTEPSLLESVDHSSFFALASPIRLGEFSAAQLTEMAERYELRTSQKGVSDLLTLTGGHPYLARLALCEAQEHEVSMERLLGDASLRDGTYAQHLHALRRLVEQDRRLLDAVRAAVTEPAAPVPFEDYCRLYSKGLMVEREPGQCRLRCPLYEDYFRALCSRR